MKRVVLPSPPDPNEALYKSNPLAYNRAVFQWQTDVKSKIEQASLQNDTPVDQAFSVSSYTQSTNLSGTSTGTDVSNFICSLIAAMQMKGLIKPV